MRVLAEYTIPHANISSSSVNVAITSGKVLTMGLRGADGSTMCVINAKDSAPNAISGKGWQAVSQSSSTTVANIADCGAFKTHGPTNPSAKEWPRTAQTDTTLGDAKDATGADYS